MSGRVRRTDELDRILALPRRRIEETPKELVSRLTALLKRPEGTWALWLAQAQALHDLGTLGGAFCPLDVGEGKTLITLLAAYILNSASPLLLLTAGLIRKTERNRADLEQHWRIPANLQFLSYEMLGRVQAKDELDAIAPDLIIADEAHKLKNPHSAVTRRVNRYMEEHPETRFMALSGTFMDQSLLEFGHILRWCLRENAPIPASNHELEEWACALDQDVDDLLRIEPGALVELASPEDKGTSLARARRGFQRRLLETPGVVSAVRSEADPDRAGCSIYVKAVTYRMKPITDEYMTKLRRDMVTPDDWQLTQASEVWRHAGELALGFHQVWDPRPPQEWRDARRAWDGYVRDTLSRSRTLDSPEDVAQAVEEGRLPAGVDRLAAWRVIRDTFTPNPVAIWHDDSAIQTAAKWLAKTGGGVVWTEHVAFAERLAEATGAPYFGPKGLDVRGRTIEDAPAHTPAIASIDANREGLNLQYQWSRCLFVSPSKSPRRWQQAIARFHRYGQRADVVEVDVFLGCAEHAKAFAKALEGAAAVRDTMGAQQKLLLADVEWPPEAEIASWRGPLWRDPPPVKFEIPSLAELMMNEKEKKQ